MTKEKSTNQDKKEDDEEGEVVEEEDGRTGDRRRLRDERTAIGKGWPNRITIT